MIARVLSRDPAQRHATGSELAEELDGVLSELRYQPRALPALLRELFGAELSSRQIPASSLTPELLAATRTGTGTGSATPAPTPATPQTAPEEINVSVGTVATPRRSRWPWWAVASIETATLLVLLFGRGGGRRTQATPALPASPPAPIVSTIPSVPSPVLAPLPSAAPVPAAAEAPAPAKARRVRGSGNGRIARGLSIDPFAEAATRSQR